jgi:hypothetical protein
VTLNGVQEVFGSNPSAPTNSCLGHLLLLVTGAREDRGANSQVLALACRRWSVAPISTSADLYWSSSPAVTYAVDVSRLRFQYFETNGNQALYALIESSAATWRVSGGNGPRSVSGEMNLQPADGHNQPGEVVRELP